MTARFGPRLSPISSARGCAGSRGEQHRRRQVVQAHRGYRAGGRGLPAAERVDEVHGAVPPRVPALPARRRATNRPRSPVRSAASSTRAGGSCARRAARPRRRRRAPAAPGEASTSTSDGRDADAGEAERRCGRGTARRSRPQRAAPSLAPEQRSSAITAVVTTGAATAAGHISREERRARDVLVVEHDQVRQVRAGQEERARRST